MRVQLLPKLESGVKEADAKFWACIVCCFIFAAGIVVAIAVTADELCRSGVVRYC